MTLVHEATADCAGTGVEVLVIAPDGEVDVPVVEAEGHIAGGVSQVPPRDRRPGAAAVMAGMSRSAPVRKSTALSTTIATEPPSRSRKVVTSSLRRWCSPGRGVRMTTASSTSYP